MRKSTVPRSFRPSAVGRADLPSGVLTYIFNLMPRHKQFIAAACVCKSWRDAAKAADTHAKTSLLLKPIRTRNNGNRRYVNFQAPRVLYYKYRCDLRCPVDDALVARSPISRSTLGRQKYLIGCSQGKIISTDYALRAISLKLTDVFTGVVHQSPPTPLFTSLYPLYSCVIGDSVLFCPQWFILRWRYEGNSWEVHSLQEDEIWMVQIIEFKDVIFGLDSQDNVFELRFEPNFSVRQLPLQWREENSSSGLSFKRQLVECDGKLMAVVAELGELISHVRFSVYRLDFSSMEWVKVDNLGDWSLFVNSVVRNAFSCRNPCRWGGQSNCVYYAGLYNDNWSVIPLNHSLEFSEDNRYNSRGLFIWPLLSGYIRLPFAEIS